VSGASGARPAFLPPLAGLGPLAGAQVAITGQRGVLGSLLAARLADGGAQVHGYPGDVNDAGALAAWLAPLHARHVFHLAAVVPVERVEADPLGAYQANVIGTFNLCRAVILRRRPAWVFQCSTSHVYAPGTGSAPLAETAPTAPATWYGTTKLAAERVASELLGKAGVPCCIGRVFSYTHARQQPPYLVPVLRQRIAALPEGGTLEVRNPSAVRDIQDAAHVVDAILMLAMADARGIVNIGSGVGRSVRDLALAVAAESGRRVTVTGQDIETGGLVADTTRLRELLAGAPVGVSPLPGCP
jgi:nucleoside-diphosphate-sugar epimerase